jgi:hypothetical protein
VLSAQYWNVIVQGSISFVVVLLVVVEPEVTASVSLAPEVDVETSAVADDAELDVDSVPEDPQAARLRAMAAVRIPATNFFFIKFPPFS